MDARSIANLQSCVSINFRNTHKPTISSVTPLQSQMIHSRETSETGGTGERVRGPKFEVFGTSTRKFELRLMNGTMFPPISPVPPVSLVARCYS